MSILLNEKLSNTGDILPLNIRQFDDNDFGLTIDDILVSDEKLGEGSFGTVYEGVYQGKRVAAKFQRFPEDPELLKTLVAELSFHRELNHPNLVQFMGACRVDPSESMLGRFRHGGVLTIMELCLEGDLKKVIDRARDKKEIILGWGLKCNIMKQVASALSYLHERQVIHRDIKTANILLDSSWTAKLCDYGLAIFEESGLRNSYYVGTDEFMAPEVQLGEEYSTKADIFSFGMILIELLTGKENLLKREARNFFAVDPNIIRNNCLPNAIPSLIELVLQCTLTEAEYRPDAESVEEWLEDILNELNHKIEYPNPRPKEFIQKSYHSIRLDNGRKRTFSFSSRSGSDYDLDIDLDNSKKSPLKLESIEGITYIDEEDETSFEYEEEDDENENNINIKKKYNNNIVNEDENKNKNAIKNMKDPNKGIFQSLLDSIKNF